MKVGGLNVYVSSVEQLEVEFAGNKKFVAVNESFVGQKTGTSNSKVVAMVRTGKETTEFFYHNFISIFLYGNDDG